LKLLLVNGNRTAAVTDAVLVEAKRVAAPGTELTAVTATFGADIVFGHAGDALAAHAVLDLLAHHYQGFDAAILAISFDSGLMAARELLPIPVLGLTESLLLEACDAGSRVGVITFGAVSSTLYREVFRRTGLESRFAAVRTIEVAGGGDYLTPAAQDERIVECARHMARENGADVVAICGAAMAGTAARLGSAAGVPLLDGTACAVRRAEALMREGYRAGPRPPGPRTVAAGVSPALTHLFAQG
jgi:allantoin racemase